MLLKKEEISFDFDGQQIPFVIINEARRSVRVAFGSKAITLRLPWTMAANKKIQHIEKSKDWAIKQLKAKPGLLSRFLLKKYKSGDYLRVGTKKYLLYFLYHQGKNDKAFIKGNLIELHLNVGNTEPTKSENIRYLIARSVANDWQPLVEKRVHELNVQYFNKTIKEVRLKLSQTNWGSCSTQGNINLSVRLLFAPPRVIDYVMVHELAHLIEHNHSQRFWNLVAKVMPDYKEHDSWLNKNSHLCEF